MNLNIYLVKRINEMTDYDQYDSMVIVAKSWVDAVWTHPDPDYVYSSEHKGWCYADVDTGEVAGRTTGDSWPHDLSELMVMFIGTAAEHQKPGVICASFNAG